ncbi:lysosomal proton-coupled steroid conjugate and bile acid symporter SLC46A3 isoform X2 [Procambarus clarkii]|uniref:lysosomal proton-coupled steroid conjugate and bile acid symporter SLC46A3 isoform X2 n=1 Tax=Procambarus clarkii TaxID=6728 RepID=UPI001E6746D3|nr:proton-coupled folate transporter-like isoform X1 [Procambarus clarkii]XP_045598776.1 proton-coupled folate transporter-like isoform X1 [Procambarus clarkii]XP_045598777.1 proton-coupled folate transporter-like isoform X1 [Procambarus clarkii]XP_045598778.1 proton-coupled folate transporter-like isoform X1 [Procambarus clarkii]XP_045598779.1 proton-coupled folate transporter-like isoform X1 [Procambarus clarkii]XP_045598780.1 proton-coupled folate transporter-like isoform X1 [Procambarus cl
MENERDDEALLPEDSESNQNIECLDSLDISTSTHLCEDANGLEDRTREQGCCRKVIKVLRGITTEPILFFNVAGWSIQSTVTTNLLLVKVCREQGYDNVTCANLSSYPEEEVAVQQMVTTINMYNELLCNIPAVLFVLFLGSWSDKHGRKIPLILPLIGSFLATLLYLINAYWMELPSMYILLAAIPRAITGGFITLLMASYSYMADITKIRARTMRIAFLDLAFGLGAPIGVLLSDYLFYRLGYLGIYGVSEIFFFIAILYTIVHIEDTRGPFSKQHLQSPELVHKPSIMCRDLFDTNHVKDTFAAVMKSRPNKGRARIIMLMAAMCSMLFIYGAINMAYLYTKRKFGWDYNQFVQLNLVGMLSSIIAVSTVLPLLSYRLQMDDSALALLGCTSAICSNIILGLAPYPWCLYLANVVACIGGLPLIVTRSIISKAVPPGEIGKIFSMLASWESILPLLSNPLYTVVYNATIKDFPGAMYFLSASFCTISAIFYIWIFVNRINESRIHLIHEENIPDIET